MVGMADSLRVVSRRQGVDGSRECAGRQGAIDSTMDRLVEQGAREPWLLFGAWFLAERAGGAAFRFFALPVIRGVFRIFVFSVLVWRRLYRSKCAREAERQRDIRESDAPVCLPFRCVVVS